MKSKYPKVGDRVKLLVKLSCLKHRNNVFGKVVRINGAYIYVKPSWCKWEVELYPNELRVL